MRTAENLTVLKSRNDVECVETGRAVRQKDQYRVGRAVASQSVTGGVARERLVNVRFVTFGLGLLLTSACNDEGTRKNEQKKVFHHHVSLFWLQRYKFSPFSMR